jgi:hypothetical protein
MHIENRKKNRHAPGPPFGESLISHFFDAYNASVGRADDCAWDSGSAAVLDPERNTKRKPQECPPLRRQSSIADTQSCTGSNNVTNINGAAKRQASETIGRNRAEGTPCLPEISRAFV